MNRFAPDGLTVTARVDARLIWDDEVRLSQVLALYEQSKAAQWNASSDIDWSIDVDFGSPLPDDSVFAMTAYEASPLARFGRPAWDTFRWEFHAWLASQFVYAEQGAVVASARLLEVLPHMDAKYFAAVQVGDEARHVEAFSRYVREKMPARYDVPHSLAALLDDLLRDARWDMTALGLHILIEGLSLAMLRLANATLHDPLIRQITHLATRDEARHVAFGILSLQGLYQQMSEAELAEREEVVLEAANLMRKWFLMDEVWERLGLPHDQGIRFAETHPMMIAYRRTVFAKIVSSLGRIDLMTPRVRNGLEQLELLVPSAGRTTGGVLSE